MTKLLIIYTGGTIGMVQDASGILVPFDFENITQNVPELKRLDYQLQVISFDPIMDSSNMSPDTWVKIAEMIRDEYAHYDGFVVLHGSDTMAYTASALSFMLENLAKPVVLTGSQLPIGEIRTDAKENLITALEIAASRHADGSPVVPEVCIYFDYRLFRGNRSRKYHSNKFEAFDSPNYPPLAEAGVHLKFNSEDICQPGKASLVVHTRLDARIASLKIFPGITEHTVRAILQSPGLKAIILESFGTGNTCTEGWFVQALKEAIGRGLVILDISQCVGGSVELGRYETSRHLKEMGVLSGHDMTFEAAVTKLMFLLGQEYGRPELERMIEFNLRGELSAGTN